MEATGQHGADLVVNAVGGSVFAENIRAMAFEGRMATVGYVDRVLHAEIDLEVLHAKRLVVFGVSNTLRSKAQRAMYVEHVARLFVLAGDSAFRATEHAAAVMDLETALAKASMDAVEKRDPEKTYNRLSIAELEKQRREKDRSIAKK